MAKTSILLKMGLDTSKMKVALDQTKKDIKTFSTSAISRLGGIAKIASGALVTGFIASAKSALQYGKELDNLANLSGATFDEFQRLTLGAKTVGIENQKLGDIFKDVNDKLGDFAQTGGGPMADFFDYIGPAIGVTIKDFQKLSGPEALQFYYDSLKKVNLSQQDMIFFMEAVASDASALIPLLDNGGKAWEEYAKKMEDAGLMLDEEMVEKLKNAEVRLDILNKKTKVATVDMLDAYRLFGAGAKQTWKELEDASWGLSGVLVGAFTLNDEVYQGGWDQIVKTFKGGIKRIKEAINDADLWSPVIEQLADLPPVTQETVDRLAAIGIEAVATMSVEQIKALEKTKDLRIKTEKEVEKIMGKVGAEQEKRATKEMTAQQQYAAAIQDRVKKQTELIGLQNKTFDDEEKSILHTKAIAEKKYEVQQALTKESENQVKFEKEQVDIAKTEFEKQKALLNIEILLAEAAGDTAKARDLKQQLSDMEEIKDIVAKTTLNEDEAAAIITRKNNMLKEQKDLQTQLEIAQGAGDQAKVAALEREIAKRDEIKALVDSTNLTEAEAEAIIDAKNARLDKQKALQLEVIKAEADGNGSLARELQNRIDKQTEAQSLMDDFNMSLDDAVALAEKLAGVRAGPDLNQSGFVTPKEQLAFDKKQKALAKEEKARNRAEIAAEKNVSAEKRKRPGLLDAKKARDKELQEQRDIKKAGKQALEDWKKQGADAPQMFDLDGNPIPNAGPNAPGGGGGGGGAAGPNAPGGGGGGGGAADPNAPGGGGGGAAPAEPKKPEQVMADLQGELAKQTALLGDIKTALKC